MAAVLRVNPTTLSTGTVVRVVDLGAGLSPRYVIESPEGVDAMGVTRWQKANGFPEEDVVAMLIAVGFLSA